MKSKDARRRLNLIFSSGAAEPVAMHASDRRYVAADKAPHSPGTFIESQMRLAFGPYHLVPVRITSTTLRWALPGGATATFDELAATAARRGWRRPTIVRVMVRRRVEVQP